MQRAPCRRSTAQHNLPRSNPNMSAYFDTRRIQFAEPRNIRSRKADIDLLTYCRRSDSWVSSPPRHEPPRPPRYEPLRYTTGPIHRGPPADCFCRYCKVPGHDIHECRKREYNISLRPGNGLNLLSKNGQQREEQPRGSKQ